jgi:hypothetical protein
VFNVDHIAHIGSAQWALLNGLSAHVSYLCIPSRVHLIQTSYRATTCKPRVRPIRRVRAPSNRDSG